MSGTFVKQKSIKYETQQLLQQYLLLHFGDKDNTITHDHLPENVFGFPQRCAQLLCEKMQELDSDTQRVLDLGCAVGGASFELTRHFTEVVGIDLSQSFIESANKIKQIGEVEVLRKEEGNLFTKYCIQLNSEIDRERVEFQVGDACALSSEFGKFDAVLLANLLCRLPNPKSCLTHLQDLVKPQGLLMITSPYSWLPEFTPESSWLCSTSDSSIEGLHAILGEHFEFVFEKNMPLIIREHARKFEYIIAHATLWRKNSN